METIRELLIALGLDVDQAKFVEAIGLEKLLEKGAELLVEALKEIPEVLAHVVESTTEWANELDDASERLGVATEKLQEYAYIGGVVGVSSGEMEVSINHLARTMAAARDGSEESVKAFSRLGVHVTDAHGKLRPLDAVLLDVSDGLHRLPKGAERGSTAMDVFGRSGAKMIQVFGQGRGRVAELTAEFQDFGIGVDEDGVKAASELNQMFSRMGMILESLKRDFAGPLVEALTPLVEEILAWVKANRALIKTKLGELAHALVSTFKALLRVASALGQALMFVITNLKFFALVLGGAVLAAVVANLGPLAALVAGWVLAGIEAVAAGAAAAASWLAAAAPVLLLAAIFAALLLILDDVRGYLEGEDSLLGDIGPKWTKFLDDFSKPRSGDPWWLAALRKAVYFVTHLYETIPDLLDKIEGFVHKFDIGILGKGDRMIHDAIVNAFSGGASSPAAAASLSAGASSRSVAVGDVNASIAIHPPAGTSADEIAGQTVDKLEEWHARKLREAAGAVGE